MSPRCRGCLSSAGRRYRCLPAPDPGKRTRRKRSKALTVTVRRVILSGRPPRVDSLEHGVIDDHLLPLYVVPADKKAQIRKLKDLLKGAVELFLATDEDREGEAIAWHLLDELKPKVPVRRMVFHEITPRAIQ